MPDRAAQIAALSLPLDQLPDPLPIPTIEKPFDVSIRPPGSKSITNRALLLAALADGTTTLRGPLIDADDAQVMLAAIQQLGAKVATQRARSASEGLDTLHITGVNGRWKISPGQTVTLNLHNAGTATRFLTAAAILAPPGTNIIIDGDARMRERPIGELADALTQLGVQVEFLGHPSCPPLRVSPPADVKSLARRVAFDDPKSSQFISAMMLVAPFLPRMLTIDVHGRLVSEPYISMTWRLMQRIVGVNSFTKSADGTYSIRMPVCHAKAFSLDIEPDASGATYFAGAAVLCKGSRILIEGLPSSPDNSLQGDVEFFQIMKFMGGHISSTDTGTAVRAPAVFIEAIRGDFEPTPDTAMTAAVLACFASPTPDNPTGGATSTLRGLRTLRVKETDRLAALQTELIKLGATIEIIQEGNDESLRITPPPTLSLRHSVTPSLLFHTYNDHRMAMSLALIGLRIPGVLIKNPGCVAKTYPTFWQDFARLYS